jgi:hypothetical protein
MLFLFERYDVLGARLSYLPRIRELVVWRERTAEARIIREPELPVVSLPNPGWAYRMDSISTLSKRVGVWPVHDTLTRFWSFERGQLHRTHDLRSANVNRRWIGSNASHHQITHDLTPCSSSNCKLPRSSSANLHYDVPAPSEWISPFKSLGTALSGKMGQHRGLSECSMMTSATCTNITLCHALDPALQSIVMPTSSGIYFTQH